MSSSNVSTLLWTPSEARQQFSENPSMQQTTHSSNFCVGYLQVNIAILPSSLADDFGEFCRLNKAPCPLLYRSKAGEVGAPPINNDSADIR
jgi:uncharacterized protein YcsI (UPF0317 family)